MKNSFLAFAAFLLLAPGVTCAATVLVGDKISIEADDVIEDDYYVSVGTLGTTVMSGKVQGDMYALAGSVTSNGVVEGDLGVIGGLAFVHASVTDDVRIIAGEVVIDDVVGGDVFVMGGVLKILSTARIGGDVVFYGAQGEISGDVEGSVYGSASQLRIDGKVGEDVDVKVSGELTLGSKAQVAGDVKYRGFRTLVRAQEAVIGGEVFKQEMEEPTEIDTWRTILIPLFISLFATLTMYLLFKREIIVVVRTINQSPLLSGVVGIASLVAGPFVSLLLISTVLGMLLGIFGIGVLLVLLAVGFSLAIIFTGALLSKLITKKVEVSLLWILCGALLFHALLFVPVVGVVFAFVLVAMAVGGTLLSLYRVIT